MNVVAPAAAADSAAADGLLASELFGLSPFPKCIVIMCQSKHKYIFYAM